LQAERRLQSGVRPRKTAAFFTDGRINRRLKRRWVRAAVANGGSSIVLTNFVGDIFFLEIVKNKYKKFFNH
jgi:hypothetical protein